MAKRKESTSPPTTPITAKVINFTLVVVLGSQRLPFQKPKFDSPDEKETSTITRNSSGEGYVDLGKKKRATVRNYKGITFLLHSQRFLILPIQRTYAH